MVRMAPLHWLELREGVSINFMDKPEPGLVPNQDLTGKELNEAIKFVDELIDLKVLRKSTDQDKVVNNSSLILVPKPGKSEE